jgi:hypothetical protein
MVQALSLVYCLQVHSTTGNTGCHKFVYPLRPAHLPLFLINLNMTKSKGMLHKNECSIGPPITEK